jgi:hypothetical protein
MLIGAHLVERGGRIVVDGVERLPHGVRPVHGPGPVGRDRWRHRALGERDALGQQSDQRVLDRCSCASSSAPTTRSVIGMWQSGRRCPNSARDRQREREALAVNGVDHDLDPPQPAVLGTRVDGGLDAGATVPSAGDRP